MNDITGILITAALSVTVMGVLMAVWSGRRERRLLKRLSDMLDRAIDGSFDETVFDESMLSALETRMVRFLGSSRETAAAAARERDEIKVLISDISHQTKTPLANMVLYTQLLGERILDQENRELVDALEEQSRKLSFLIDSLVKLSRLESGIIQVRPCRSRVSPLLKQAAAQIEPAAREKDICLECCETDVSAVFDPKWTGEALYNLLSNAVKYTPPKGRVTVHVSVYQFFVRIEVSDTGIGIAEDEQSKIFTRFYRSEAMAEEDGVGIGLYLAREIVQAQGGYMQVRSVVGRGAVFYIYLPA